MTALGFYEVTNPSDDKCGICWDNLNNGKPVATHEVGPDGSDGALHPFHLECIKTSLVSRDKCMVCQHKLDRDSAFSLKTRVNITHTFLSNATIGTIVGFCASELTRRAVEIGYASIPVIATLAQEIVSNEPLAMGLSFVGALGVGTLVTGGIILGPFVLANAFKHTAPFKEIPLDHVYEEVQGFGLLSGAIVSLATSTLTGAIVGGIIAGSISVLNPDLFRSSTAPAEPRS